MYYSKRRTKFRSAARHDFSTQLHKGLGRRFLSSPPISLARPKQGENYVLHYGIYPSPFGDYLLACTQYQQICKLAFIEAWQQKPNAKNKLGMLIQELKAAWPQAELLPHSKAKLDIARNIFGGAFHKNSGKEKLRLLIPGTAFQHTVWTALSRIRSGEVASYAQLAAFIKKPKAVRAVANALAKNHVSYLIPCHRIISQSGYVHRYRWGTERKLAMLLAEHKEYLS